MYNRTINDRDRQQPAEIKVTALARIVMLEADWTGPDGEDEGVTLCYSRKQALTLALVLLVAIFCSFRRFR